MQYLLLFMVAVTVSMLVTPWAGRLAFRVGAVDRPNNRKIHQRVMPRLGGLAVFAGFAAASALLPAEPRLTGLLLGGAVILLLGLLDDTRGLSPKVKLLGQSLAAAIVVAFGIRIDFINNPFNGYFYLGAFSIPFTIFWIVAITNAINLIDGLDGLASGVSAIVLLTFAVIAHQIGQTTVSLLALALAAAVLGFLRYNFYPAKIFLGDCGSMFLGFMVAVLAVFGLLKGLTVVTFVAPVIVLGVPVFDTCFAIMRRFYEHRPIFQADKGHLHHRLLSQGYSHRQAVLFIYFLSLIFSAGALLLIYNTTASGQVL
ncbi:MAG: undecaprenyl/decaprenyl-phosphate alpha-N-acetylglucosaminyl 1-phosphate transferase [Firmicutes bacterium]|nr:undecaprenyl/decaprenyl-phosphate alpha-N-acetylglucosaminyl 1-phosphate transferase [Bacillota bacterium]